MKLGQTLSGLLNASFGNAVEIIVGIAALLQGMSNYYALFIFTRLSRISNVDEMRIVQTSVRAKQNDVSPAYSL